MDVGRKDELLAEGVWDMNQTYDARSSEYAFKDYSFSKLNERYSVWTGSNMEDNLFDILKIKNECGKLTNAGALLADNSPVYQSRLFCTHWNGLSMCGGLSNAVDSAEYSGSLILLLEKGIEFVKRNMKTTDSESETLEYCEKSIFEALVNALIHRDYTTVGSEVHIDMYDDRLTVYSPGGMADGSKIQERDITKVDSICRNPVLANIFTVLGYMNCRGGGLKKIIEAYREREDYCEKYEPKFHSGVSDFEVTLYNLKYNK